jgi:phosphopantothenoylcysteine decarboxylase / phosphopantothenate---cysteine ligase
MLQGKKIIIGISGGIAAYKTPVLIRLFKKAGAEVRVIATQNAFEFVTRATLETVSQNKVYSEVFSSGNDYTTEHVSVTDWGDIFIVAPATANIIGKYANGIADDALSTSLIAFDKPVFIAPSMNDKMFRNPAVQNNIEILKKQHVNCIEPAEGFLACGTEGKGRMEEPETIFSCVERFLKKKAPLAGKKVIVTAGPTYEAIDPVRFIGNFSSGLMGFSVAEHIAGQGAEVTLIAGPTKLSQANSSINRIDVTSADDMYNAVMKHYLKADIIVMAAAVADFTLVHSSKIKIKKTDNINSVQLKPTKDILAALGEKKQKNQVLVGFALETNDEINNALKKLHTKNLDFIVLNSLNDKGAGFGTHTNKVTFVERKNKITKFELKSKELVAKDIVEKIIQIVKKQT